MRKQTSIIIIIIIFFPIIVFSQSCLPDGITFTTQTQVDSFQINYPNCTKIEGDLKITWSDITSLTKLNVLTNIEGDLLIQHNSMLTTLSGLQNIDSIYGSLGISSNDSLINLSGFNSITSVGGSLVISNNGLLENLNGLDNLTNISYFLKITENLSLTSITGLLNLISINGLLEIRNNPALLSLYGLNNINQGTYNVEIFDNQSLSDCAVASICNYLSSPIGKINIYSNDTGCNSPPEIANSCGFTMPCLPYGDYYLLSQSEVDGFHNDYSQCEQLNGSLILNGEDITDLYGLYHISSIEENLSIIGCNNLNTLVGLTNLSNIGEYFGIRNNESLQNLTGIHDLTYIGGGLSIWGNDSLLDLDELEQLTTLKGSLNIWYNNTLNDISGIENIYSSYLTSVSILHNPYLSECDVLSICSAILFIEESCFFEENASGCDSIEEVELACETMSLSEFDSKFEYALYPNPGKDNIYIELQQGVEGVRIELFDGTGKQILNSKITTTLEVVLPIGIKPGMYYYRIYNDKKILQTGKWIKS
ncbi:MAG: T9SS type A sorting domain-containing protein [Bacteroidota bacterium]